MEEREEEENRLTGAIKTRMLLPIELIQLTTFMLNNSNVMEEWRNFYENAKSMSGKSRIFPMFQKYIKRSWLKWINCWHKEKVYHVFQRSQMMFAPLFMDH